MSSGHRSFDRILAAAPVALLLLCGAGCLYVPTPNAEPLAGREVRDEELAFLQAGVTTKEDVVAQFGSPTFFWRDENVLVYRWVKRHGVLLWAIGGPYNAAVGATDIPQEKAFLLKFDADDCYVNSEILEKPAFKSYGDFLLGWRDAQRARGWEPKEGDP